MRIETRNRVEAWSAGSGQTSTNQACLWHAPSGLFFLLAALLAVVVPAEAVTLNATAVEANSFWINESYAIGPTQSDCNSSSCCAQNNTSTAAYLKATSFDTFTLPVDQVITAVEVDVNCRSSAGTSNNQVRIQVSGSVESTLGDSPIWDQSSTDTACRWIMDGTGWNITYLKPSWSQADIQNLNVAVRRVRGPQSEPLRVNAFRIRVTTQTLPPVCSITPGSLDFGQVGVGLTSTNGFSITNTGYGVLTGTVSSPCSNFPIVSGGGVYSLTNGQSRLVTVRFAPAAYGPAACTISTGCGSGISVQGTGVPTGACCQGWGQCDITIQGQCGSGYMGDGTTCASCPTCQVSPSHLDFGQVATGSWKQLDLTLTNVGGGMLTGAIGWTGSSVGFQIVGSSGYSLGTGQSQTISVIFEPEPGQSYFSADLDMGCGQYVSVSGSGVNSTCTVSHKILDFGEVVTGQTADRTITLTNPGPGWVTGNVYSSCSRFTILSPSSVQLGAGQSAQYTVRFSPQVQDIPVDEIIFDIGSGQQTLAVLAIGEGLDVSGVQPVVPVPTRFLLQAPSPNPAQGSVLLRYDIPLPGAVHLEVFDVQGRRVRLLGDEFLEPGSYSALWDRRGETGLLLPNGVYYVRLRTSSGAPQTRTVVLN